MFSNANVALKQAKVALTRGNLDAACRILSDGAIQALKKGQELIIALKVIILVKEWEDQL